MAALRAIPCLAIFVDCSPIPSAIQPISSSSLVSGRIISQDYHGPAGCSDENCFLGPAWRGVYGIGFGEVQTHSGPTVPTIITTRMGTHAEPRDDIRLVMIITPIDEHTYSIESLNGVWDGQACLGVEDFERLEVPVPEDSYIEASEGPGADSLCFPVR